MKQVLTLIAVIGLGILHSEICAGQDATENEPSQMSREEWQARVKASQQRADVTRREHRVVAPQPRRPEDLDEEASRRVLEDDSLAPATLSRRAKVSSSSEVRPTENASPMILFGFADLRSISAIEVLTCADDSAQPLHGDHRKSGE